MIRFSPAAMMLMLAAPVSAEPFDGLWRVQMQRTYGVCDRDSIRYSVDIQHGTMRYIPDPGEAPPEFHGRVSQNGRVAVWARQGMAELKGTGDLGAHAGSGVWKASLLGCSGAWTARKAPERASLSGRGP
jgi:hypothetical protein